MARKTTNSFSQKTPRKLYHGGFRDLERQLAQEIGQRRDTLAPLHVVCPTRLLALHLQRTLGRSLPHGHINVHFTTLTGLTTGQTAPSLGLQLLCRRIARDLFSKGYFAPVHDTAGFASALLATFTDLDEACIASLPGKTPKLRELAAGYAEFRSWLKEENFATEADLFRSSVSGLQSSVFLYGFYDLNTAQRRLIEQLAPAAVFFPTGNEFTQPLLDWFQSLNYELVECPISHLPSPISVVSCPGEPAEVREALRTALDWLRAHPDRTFNDIAILARTRDQYDTLLRDAFQHLGLPVFVRGGRPLAEHADAKLLLLLLETIATDYPRANVMELACQGGARSHWDELSLELGITAGRAQWLSRLPQSGQLVERSFQELATFRRFVEELLAAGELVPTSGRWTDFIAPVLNAWRSLGGKHAGVETAVNELAGLEPFQSRVTLTEFSAACQQALKQAHEPTLPYEGGGIFVGDVMNARGLSWPLVIVLGLVEKSFPRVIREDPLLLDDERQQISADLPLKRRGHAEERLLFDLATASAREQLALSYPRLDPATARPRLRSCLLRPFGTEEKIVPLAGFEHRDDALDVRERDLALLADAKKAPPALLAEMSPHLARGLAAEHTRWSKAALTVFDGLAPAAGAALPVSPTELETFAFCPFKYFNKHMLGLERWEEPERIWSADPGEIGTVVHDILERFFKEAVVPLQPKLRDTYRQQLRKIAAERFAAFEHEGVTGLPVIWSLRQAALLRDLLKFLDLEIERADELVPREFEKKFGPVSLQVSERLALSVKGRIDRIDSDGKRARILDYKTGKAYHKKDDHFDGGEALQLPLYALGAEQLLKQTVVSSEYAYLTANGEYRYVRFTREALDNRAGELARILETFAAMLRAGEFPQYTAKDRCAWCDFRPICTNAVEQLAERKKQDNRLAPFLAVKEIE